MRNSQATLDSAPTAVIICCSALMREINALSQVNGWQHIEVQCISAELHNYPDKITAAVKTLIDQAKVRGLAVFVAYADCGTGGLLDVMLEAEQVERIPGAHCYEFYLGAKLFDAFHQAELGTFYLTDFLVRHFDRLVIRGLGLDKKPELEPLYFGNYRKLVYIAQSHDQKLQQGARRAAARLGLQYHYHFSGSGDLGHSLRNFNQQIAVQLV